jgi:hypothetical protein
MTFHYTVRSTMALMLGLAATSCQADPADPPSASTEAQPPAGGKADSPFGEGADIWDRIAERCGPPAEDEPILHANEFSWGYDREGMAARFDAIYASGMRLVDRAYYEEETGTFVLTTSEAWGKRVTMPKRLIENVSRHIGRALKLGYVDQVFFPDMGHSHFFIPDERWESDYASVPVPQMADRYTRLLDDPDLLVLYHTAEQLQMLDENDQLLPDPWVQWRFFTRNLVGDNDGHTRLEILRDDESKANTARDYPGHHYFGAGFNISASENGCFPYEQDGETRWFDLSLSDLPYDSDGGDFY